MVGESDWATPKEPLLERMPGFRWDHVADPDEVAALTEALEMASTTTHVLLTLSPGGEQQTCEIVVDQKCRVGNSGSVYQAKKKVKCPQCNFLGRSGGYLWKHFEQCIPVRLATREACSPLPGRPLTPRPRARRWTHPFSRRRWNRRRRRRAALDRLTRAHPRSERAARPHALACVSSSLLFADHSLTPNVPAHGAGAAAAGRRDGTDYRGSEEYGRWARRPVVAAPMPPPPSPAREARPPLLSTWPLAPLH